MSISNLLLQYGDRYIQALLTTWRLTAFSFATAFALGVFITVLRVCPIRPLRSAGDFYVQIFRNIPGVALLILLPEGIAALAAARKNDLQKSINLALGSSLATIGLTVPAVAIATYVLDKRLVLGLETRDTMLLIMTFLVSLATFGTGRTNILFGLVHLVMFAVFIFLVLVP